MNVLYPCVYLASNALTFYFQDQLSIGELVLYGTVGIEMCVSIPHILDFFVHVPVI